MNPQDPPEKRSKGTCRLVRFSKRGEGRVGGIPPGETPNTKHENELNPKL